MTRGEFIDSIEQTAEAMGDTDVLDILGKIVMTDEVETMATNAHNIFVSPEFAASITPKQAVGVLVHEMMHDGLLHHQAVWAIYDPDSTLSKRQWHYLANVAEDIVINEWLLKHGYDLPGDCCVRDKFTPPILESSTTSAEMFQDLVEYAKQQIEQNDDLPDWLKKILQQIARQLMDKDAVGDLPPMSSGPSASSPSGVASNQGDESDDDDEEDEQDGGGAGDSQDDEGEDDGPDEINDGPQGGGGAPIKGDSETDDSKDQNGQSGGRKSETGKDDEQEEQGNGGGSPSNNGDDSDDDEEDEQTSTQTGKKGDKDDEEEGGSAGDKGEEGDDVTLQEVIKRVASRAQDIVDDLTAPKTEKQKRADSYVPVKQTWIERIFMEMGRYISNLGRERTYSRPSRRPPQSLPGSNIVTPLKGSRQQSFSARAIFYLDCSGSMFEDRIDRPNNIRAEIEKNAPRLRSTKSIVKPFADRVSQTPLDVSQWIDEYAVYRTIGGGTSLSKVIEDINMQVGSSEVYAIITDCEGVLDVDKIDKSHRVFIVTNHPNAVLGDTTKRNITIIPVSSFDRVN